MSLIEQIKAKNLEARKAKLTAVVNVLTPLIGEAEMVGKNAGHPVTDAEVVQMIKKFIKNLDETITALGDSDPRTLSHSWARRSLSSSTCRSSSRPTSSSLTFGRFTLV